MQVKLKYSLQKPRFRIFLLRKVLLLASVIYMSARIKLNFMSPLLRLWRTSYLHSLYRFSSSLLFGFKVAMTSKICYLKFQKSLCGQDM